VSDQAANLPVDTRLQHFACLGRIQQEQAIRRLAAAGYHDCTIAAATKLSVEMVRRVIGVRQ
jgi:hypothetical protein